MITKAAHQITSPTRLVDQPKAYELASLHHQKKVAHYSCRSLVEISIIGLILTVTFIFLLSHCLIVLVSGDVLRIPTPHEDNFGQASVFYNKVLNEAERSRLVDNISGHLAGASPFIQERAVKNFAQVSSDLGSRLSKSLKLKTSANL